MREAARSYPGQRGWWITCSIVIGLGVLSVIACAGSWTLPFETNALSFEVEDVEIVTCRDLDGYTPVSVTDVFTENDRRICVSVRAQIKSNVEEIRTMLPPDTELFPLTAVEYYEGKRIGEEYRIGSSYTSDGWVTGGYCVEVVEGSLPKGRYRVEIKILSTEVGAVEYQVQ